MNYLGVEINAGRLPELDPGFIPLHLFNEAFLKTAKKPIGIAVERANGETAAFPTFIHGTPEMQEADRYYIRRLVKTLLWMKGGYKVYCDDKDMYAYLHDTAFCDGGIQDFDYHYFTNIFEHPFEVLLVDRIPESKDNPKPMGGHLEGCRIGFDAGGSDRKVSAVIDGETVADVLEYVQYSPKKLVRTVETWVTKCVKEGKITVEEGKEFLSNYRSGLYGYTYLE